MYKRLKLAWQLWRQMGSRWLLFRVSYAIQVRTGILRLRMPAFAWRARSLRSWLKSDVPDEPEAYRKWRKQHGGHFFFDELPAVPANASWDTQPIVEAADEILGGKWPYFGHTIYIVGHPPDWHVNPMTGQRIAADRHWTQIGDFENGDIKLVWEASRFGVAYTLVRAYAATGDERYPETFWRLAEDWAKDNPPHMGPNWKCGQEAAFRVMAWCFALWGLAKANCTTPARVAMLATMIAVHAQRIERNIVYARSQKNNHAISESVALWTIGLLFPEFERAAHWRAQGSRVIEAEVERQIYLDGSYVQHSNTYHRVMLHDLIWALLLGEINGHHLHRLVYAKVGKAVDFLYQLLDMQSGCVPNYGANDGTVVLPLNTCNRQDYRPVLQAGYYLLYKRRLFQPGAWDEDLFWLLGSDALNGEIEPSPSSQIDLAAPDGGYYTLRGPQSWAMIRCANYCDRPSQADQLHCDLWWHGINIACDAGSYLYNGEQPWDNGLCGTGIHNTVMVDGMDQMTRASRFLWLDWAQGIAQEHIRSSGGHLAYWQGEHTGYMRLPDPVRHRRSVMRIGDNHWLVLDTLEGQSMHEYSLQWLLSDLPRQVDPRQTTVTLETPFGAYEVRSFASSPNADFSIAYGEQASTCGWQSLYYAVKEPAPSLRITQHASCAHFWTLFQPANTTVTIEQDTLYLEWKKLYARVTLSPDALTPLPQRIQVSGQFVDTLEIHT